MDVFLLVLAIIALLVGFAGCVAPIIPGPPLGYVGLLLLYFTKYSNFTSEFMWIWAGIVVAVTLLDYFLPPLFANRFGGSKYGTWGATAGMFLGFFVFAPIGIIIGPFVGALVGELIYDRSNSAKALKVAFGAFMAFIVGTGLKLATVGVMIFYAIKTMVEYFYG